MPAPVGKPNSFRKAEHLRRPADFRRVYATAIKSWMGYGDAAGILRGEFEPLPIVQA